MSNESNFDVFFDNIQVIHRPGPMMEETHYYPFGLTMAGISSKAAGRLENRHKFNKGTELNESLDLNWYETPHRSFDPQIGRFLQVDALSDMSYSASPYVYSTNNPLIGNDPTGLRMKKVGKSKKGEDIMGESDEEDTLNEVVIKPSSRKKPSRVSFMYWPSYGNKSGKQHQAETDEQLARLRDGKSLLPYGNHAFYQRAWKAEQDWRAMNKATLGYLGAAAALPSLIIYAPAAARVLTMAVRNEMSLLRTAKLSPKMANNLRTFGANLGLQYVFNGTEADYWDAFTTTVNPYLALATNSLIDMQVSNGQILPGLISNEEQTLETAARNFTLSAVFTTFGQTMSTLNPALGPSFDYLINVIEAVMTSSMQERKEK